MPYRLAAFLALVAAAATARADDLVSHDRTARIGGMVDVTEPVEGDLRAVGGTIRIDAPVDGSARLAGGEVVVKGAVKGQLRAAAGRVVIDGPVGGDAIVGAGTLELGPNARIAGKVRFAGGHLERDPAAEVVGGIRHSRGDSRDHFRQFGWWVWTAGLMVLAAIVAGALPGPVGRLTGELRAHPWTAPLFGFIALVCIPVAAVLFMVTIIGIPLGLLALLGYFALLLVGYVCASVVVGGLLLDRYKADVAGVAAWRVGVAVLTMLAIALVARIPVVGGLVAFAALLVGVGMIVAAVVHREAGAPAAS